ncbi:MAG: DUF3489 domain-containing protein [Mesorhizobium sp.]
MTTTKLSDQITVEAAVVAGKPVRARKASSNVSLDKPKRDTADVPRAKDTKAELVLKKLHLVRGATIDQLIETTGWQAHSVRGFLSAVVRKKLGLALTSEVAKDGQRRYRVVDASESTIGNAG